ncbi:MAG: hypothetical protein ABSF34_17435, partial [Verrucomicrobiota bacterium]
GVADFYINNDQLALLVNSAVINNPNGAAVRLVITGYAAADTTTLNFGGTPNSPGSGTGVPYSLYSGGLVVNGGTVVSNGTIPGGPITLNGAVLTLSGGSSIAAPPVFTLNNSTMNVSVPITVGGLAFNSTGSSGNFITLQTNGANLTLPSNGAGITSTPTSVSSNDIATINSSFPTAAFLSLNGVAQTFTVYPTLVNGVNMTPLQAGLLINTAIIIDNAQFSGITTPGSIILTGGGVLQLNAQNTFSGGIHVEDGSSLIIGGSSNPVANGAVVSGPLGTGTLTLDPNSSLISTGAFIISPRMPIHHRLISVKIE